MRRMIRKLSVRQRRTYAPVANKQQITTGERRISWNPLDISIDTNIPCHLGQSNSERALYALATLSFPERGYLAH